MNFFGHAAVAGRFSELPAFVLGAMLPDFCAMLGLGAPPTADPALRSGILFHHLTDAAFHELTSFRELCSEGSRHLSAIGVARGTARAAAHVGVELWLDSTLAESPSARAASLAALAAGPSALACVDWPSSSRARLGALAERLTTYGIGAKPAASVVFERLERTLSRRPRLAISEADRSRVSEWVELCKPRVVAWAPRLETELTSELERRFHA